MLAFVIAAALALPQDATKMVDKPAAPKAVPAAKTVPAAKIVPVAGAAQAEVEPLEPTLTPGSPAPFPDIANFIKGDSLAGFEPGKTYVIEFWATWCGPCIAGMPHLTELQAKYADQGVRIIGISDEPVTKVNTFLAKPGSAEKTGYTLCSDEDRSAHNQYMKPALQNGIPCAFIVKDNVVQWIGHPMGMDDPIAEVVAGTWDLAKSKQSFAGEMQAKKVQRRTSGILRESQKSGDYKQFFAMLDEAIAKATPQEALGMEMQKFQILIGPANQPEAGYALGRKVVAALVELKNASGLNQIAWNSLTSPGIKVRDIPFCLAAAKAASEASKGEDGAILDTLARAYWESGEKLLAISTQQMAIAKTPEGTMLDEMKETLQGYETGSPGSNDPI